MTKSLDWNQGIPVGLCLTSAANLRGPGGGISKREMPPRRLLEGRVSALPDARMDGLFRLRHRCCASGPVARRRRRKTHAPPAPCSPAPPRALYEARFDSDGLAQLRPLVSRMVRSPASFFILSVTAPGYRFPVCVVRKDRRVFLALLVQDAEHERAVCGFLRSRGLHNLICPQNPAPWLGNRQAIAGQLPLSEELITAVVAILLRNVYGVGRRTGLEFMWYASG